jgi:hypothetical protein
MIVAISRQITEVQNAIGRILREVDRAIELIGNIPSQTIQGLYQARINGANARYQSQMYLYREDVEKSGIQAAQEIHKEVFQKYVVDPLYIARTDLMSSYREYSLIPIVASAMFVEVHALIMTGERSSVLRERLGAYKDWLRLQVTTTSDGQLDIEYLDALSKYEALVRGPWRINQLAALAYHECFTKEEGWPERSSRETWPTIAEIQRHVSRDSHGVRLTEFPGAGQRLVAEAISSGALPAHRRPFAAVAARSAGVPPYNGVVRVRVTGDDRVWRRVEPSVSIAQGEAREVWTDLSDAGLTVERFWRLQPCTDEMLSGQHRMEVLAAEITDLGFKVITRRLWRRAAWQALLFIEDKEQTLRSFNESDN